MTTGSAAVTLPATEPSLRVVPMPADANQRRWTSPGAFPPRGERAGAWPPSR